MFKGSRGWLAIALVPSVVLLLGAGSVGAQTPTSTTTSVTTLPAFQKQPYDAELVPLELKLSTPTGYPGGSVLLTGRCPASKWAEGHIATTNLGPTSFKISADRTFSVKVVVPTTASKVRTDFLLFCAPLGQVPETNIAIVYDYPAGFPTSFIVGELPVTL